MIGLCVLVHHYQKKGRRRFSQESSRGWNGYFFSLIFLLHLYYLPTCCSLYDTLHFHSFRKMPSLLLCSLLVCYYIGLCFIITWGTLTSWKGSSCAETLHTQPASMHAQTVNTLLWLMHKESHTHCREQWEKCCRLQVKHMRTLCLKHESPRKMKTTTGPTVQHYPGPGPCVIILSIIVCVCRVSAFAHLTACFSTYATTRLCCCLSSQQAVPGLRHASHLYSPTQLLHNRHYVMSTQKNNHTGLWPFLKAISVNFTYFNLTTK